MGPREGNENRPKLPGLCSQMEKLGLAMSGETRGPAFPPFFSLFLVYFVMLRLYKKVYKLHDISQLYTHHPT